MLACLKRMAQKDDITEKRDNPKQKTFFLCWRRSGRNLLTPPVRRPQQILIIRCGILYGYCLLCHFISFTLCEINECSYCDFIITVLVAVAQH